MSSVLDTNRKHSTTSLAFLDPNGGVAVQRYDMLKYRQFDKLTESQLGYYWRPDEIDLSKDGSDFKTLSEAEEFGVTYTLSRQILLDSVQGRAPNLAFLPIVSLPELEAWITTWAFSETIHSRSYTHILRNVFPDPSKVFDSMMDIQDLVDCAGDISKCYDDLIDSVYALLLLGEGEHEVTSWKHVVHVDSDGKPQFDEDTGLLKTDRVKVGTRIIDVDLYKIKKLLWLCIMSVNILEGVRFYASFAFSWAMAENKKLEGNAKIIKLICMSDDHEILTEKGWQFFNKLGTDRVAQYNQDGVIEFVQPINFIEEDFDGDMVGYKTSDVDVLYTPEHRVIYDDKTGLREAKASDFRPACNKSYIVSGFKRDGRADLTNLERFRIAVQADGFISDRYTGEVHGTIPIIIQLKKKRKIERLSLLLESLKDDYAITYRIDSLQGANQGMVAFKIDVPLELSISKDFSWVDLCEINCEWASEFLNELSLWDGHRRYGDFSDIYYSSKDKACTDMVQAIASICGKIHHKSVQEDNRKDTYSDIHRIHGIKDGTTRCCGGSSTRSSRYYKGRVYCVTVPSGMIVVRRNGKVVVTGNCRDENLHLAATQTLLKLLPKDDPDYIKIADECQDKAIELFKQAVDQEKEWCDFLFSKGSVIGLNADILKSYVEWIANKRMTGVGLPSPYKGGANPLPWTAKWISGADVQPAPQESEITSYQIGATKQDVTEETFKGFSL